MRIRSANTDIFLLGVIRFSDWFMLYMPVVKLFYVQNGLNNFQLFLLHGVYSAVITLLEIPSGYAADLWGRKQSLVIGTIAGFVGFVLFSISNDFWGFLFAEVALGIGAGFVSGSDSALLYDTLSRQNKEAEYMKYEGRLSGVGNFAEAFAGLGVSALMWLGMTDLRNVYILQSAVALTGVPAALLLSNYGPSVHLLPKQFSHILHVVKDTLWVNRHLRNTLLFSAITGFSTLTMAWFAQIYFYEVKLPDALFGLMWTALNLMVGLGSLYAYRIERKLGMKTTIWLVLLFICGSYFINAYLMSLQAIAILFVFYLVRGVATPALKDYLNRITSSDVRATVLSIRSLVIRMMYAVIGPILGWLSDVISLRMALLLAGTAVLIPGLFTAILIIRHREPQ